MINIANKIYELRIQRNWNENELSKNANIQRATVSSWFVKSSTPTVYSLELVCNAFGITLSQFFSESGEPVSLTQQQKTILDKYNKLSQEDKKEVGIFIDGMLTK